VTLAPLNFQYQNFSMKIVDNGHTIQVNSNGESSIVYEGVTYSFKQFHYHHKSEHTFEGNFRDLEIHLVHRDDLTGNLLVLGIWVTPGAANNLMEAVKLNIPVEKFSEQSTSISINATDLLPSDAQTLNPKYYRYTGSLTTPPCTQGVTWVMFHNPITMSQTQIDAFAQMYEVNNRPVQPLNNRIVFEQQ
jgi:carbonic anhydrase